MTSASALTQAVTDLTGSFSGQLFSEGNDGYEQEQIESELVQRRARIVVTPVVTNPTSAHERSTALKA